MFKDKLNKVIRRKREYYNNIFKAYTELQERYKKALKAIIEVRTDYKINIYNNMVELLKAIKEYVLNY